VWELRVSARLSIPLTSCLLSAHSHNIKMPLLPGPNEMNKAKHKALKTQITSFITQQFDLRDAICNFKCITEIHFFSAG